MVRKDLGRRRTLSDEERKKRNAESKKRWQQANREKNIIANKKWREAHREQWLKSSSEYQKRYQKRRWKEDPEWRKKQTENLIKWQKKNPERVKQYTISRSIRKEQNRPELKDDWLNFESDSE